MSRFSPSDAALEGFRLTREKPLAVLVWAVVQLIFGVISMTLEFGLGGKAFQDLLAVESGASKVSPDALQPLAQQLTPTFLLVFLVSLIFYSILYTALLRAVLRPADKAFAYLRLSMDEVRQLVLSLIFFVLFLVYALVLSVISGILIALTSGLGQARLLLQILAILALIAGFAYPAVRLSLAPAMTFADGRITLFRSLPLTKQQFWSMAGAYVLGIVLTVVVFLLGAVVFTFVSGALAMAEGGLGALPVALGAMQPADMTLSGFLSPGRIPSLVFGALLGTLGYAILFAPGAVIFRELTGRVGAPTVSTASAKPGKPWG
jgi:hypothetical protein